MRGGDRGQGIGQKDTFEVAFLASMSFDCNLLVSVVSLLRLCVRFNARCINLPMNLKWVPCGLRIRGNFADWVTE